MIVTLASCPIASAIQGEIAMPMEHGKTAFCAFTWMTNIRRGKDIEQKI